MSSRSVLLFVLWWRIFSGVYACIHVPRTLQTPRTAPIARRQIPSHPEGVVALENVRIFDGYGLRDPSTIFIKDGRISRNAHNVTGIVRGEGRVLIPGLIDSHLHVSALDDLETLSSYGVTTALNMNCPDYSVCLELRNQTGVTQIFSAGLAAIGNGSAHARILDLSPNQTINSPIQAAPFVQINFAEGFDFLKIVSEFDGPDESTQSALVKEAVLYGKLSMTHASQLYYYHLAVNSGSKGIQHIASDALLTDAIVQTLAQQGQFVTPTLNVFKLLDTEPAFLDYLTGSTTTNESFAIASENVRTLHASDIPLLAGTDAIGNHGPIIDPFGVTLHWELQYLVAAGMTPAEALRAATSVPALYHGLTDRGSIKEGQRADLILLNSNPLENITNTLDIARVWIGGIEYHNVTNPSRSTAGSL